MRRSRVRGTTLSGAYDVETDEAGVLSPMGSVEIEAGLPTAAEYNRLRTAIGWGSYEEDVITRFLPNSPFGVCARAEGSIVGMARLVGDGGLVFYLQDVIVLPRYQGRGIGTRLMDRVMAYLHDHAHHNTIVGLMAATGKEPFYASYGFTARPTPEYGAGMTLFWSRP